MLLRSLHIVRLHGALTLDVNFNDDITLLVGINGSGKTSVLNVIDWLLKPDLKRLALVNYSELVLHFDHGSKPYSLKATKSPTLVTLALVGPGITVKPITVNLIKTLDLDDEDVEDAFSHLRPEKHEMPMWKLLKSFTKPTVISLDRTISAEADDAYYVETARVVPQHRKRARSPLTHVQDVTAAKFAEYREKSIQHDNELKARIVMSALQDREALFHGETIKPMTKQDITLLESKIIEYLTRTIKTEDVTQQVRRFFNSAKFLSQPIHDDGKNERLLRDVVLSQYRQVENLAEAFNDFERKNASAFKELKDYLSAVNQFFGDSKKSLYFDESTGKLVFRFTDPDYQKQEKSTLDHLSSGEKQVLILFTFLAFIAKRGSVFIVDEPELSLHPKWQRDFMAAFLQLRPPNAQLLLATHSPEIVGRFKDACVTLRSREHG